MKYFFLIISLLLSITLIGQKTTWNHNGKVQIKTDGSMVVDDSTFVVDGTNNKVGIGTLSPTVGSALTVSGRISQIGLGNSTFIGFEAGKDDDLSGNSNVAIGYQASYSNLTASYNVANGYQALYTNLSGAYNTAIGYQALYSNSGRNNAANGYKSLYFNTSGFHNTAIGSQAGSYIADKTTAATITNNSVFLGYRTSPLADDETNQIVIGYDAIGAGSNSVVLGNDSITKTLLKGNVGIGLTSTAGALNVFTGTATHTFSSIEDGSISFLNGFPGVALPTIVGKSVSQTGLSFSAMSSDTPPYNIDMLFDIREHDNTDFATITNLGGFAFLRSGTELLRIARDGNTGINAGTPANKLSVGGNVSIGDNYTGLSAPTNGLIVQGNVGIGTTSPIEKFHLQGAYNTDVKAIISAGDQSKNAYLYLSTPYNGDAVNYGTKTALIAEGTTGWSRSKLHFALSNSTSDTYDAGLSDAKMTILPTGEVGIGTTIPTTKLDINGILRLRGDDVNEGGQIDFDGGGSYPETTYLDRYQDQFRIFTTNATNSNVNLFNLGAGSMDLFVDGNVGIGTTSPSQKLDVVGQIQATSRISAGIGTGSVAMTLNDGYGNANLTFNHLGGKADVTGNAGRIEVNVDATTNSAMSFELKDNLTAGVATSLNEVMILYGDGKVKMSDYGVGANVGTATYSLAVDASGNVIEEPLASGGGGWHGSETRIKILPSDFASTVNAHSGIENSTTSTRFRDQNVFTYSTANYEIPIGYKAKDITIYRAGTLSSGNVNIYTSDITTGTIGASLGSASNCQTCIIDFADVTSTATNFLVVKVYNAGYSDGYINGGFITIEKL